MCFSMILCWLQAVVAGKKLTKVEKQDTLRDLVSEGWLASAPGQNGYYCLGVSAVRVCGLRCACVQAWAACRPTRLLHDGMLCFIM